jgi:type IV pilus assembly protein PilF
MKTALLILTSALLAGCTTTTTTTQLPAGAAPVPSAGDARAPADGSDVERRARLRTELAAGYFSRGQFDTALAEIRLALAARPDMPEALNLRGLIYGALNEPALAEESFRRALQLGPRDGDTMHNYGWFLCQARRYPEAEAQFRLAMQQPQYRDGPRTLFALGVCQARAGRWVEAEATLSRAYELDPGNPVTGYNLSEVLYRRGEFERARFYMRRVNGIPDFVNAQTLWLAARIEVKLGNEPGARVLGNQLRERFPQSPEALLFDQGRFND